MHSLYKSKMHMRLTSPSAIRVLLLNYVLYLNLNILCFYLRNLSDSYIDLCL